MFKAVISDVKLWRSLLAAVSTLVEEADFNATPEGVKLRSMDPSHVAMVDFEWPKNAFEQYECPETTKIRVSLTSMLKLLRRVGSNESLEMSYDKEAKKLNMSLKGNILRKFTMSTMEPSEEEVPTPKLDFNSKIKLATKSLSDIIEDAQAVSENVRLETMKEKFVVNVAGELSSAVIELEKSSEVMFELDVKEPSKSTYNLSYLAGIVKTGASASEVVSLEFSTNMPIKIEFELPQKGHLLYYLAPRIEPE